METNILNRLLADASVSEIVGNKIYVPMAPQGTKAPYITFQRVTTKRQHGMGSDSNEIESRFQVSCVAKTYLQVKALATVVNASLSRWRQNSPIKVHGTYQTSERDIGREGVTKTMGVQQEYRIIFEEV